jgi:hypothetical protein
MCRAVAANFRKWGGGWMNLCDQCAKAANIALSYGGAIMAVYRPAEDAVSVFVDGGAVTLSRDEATKMRDALSGALSMREQAASMVASPVEMRL